MYTHFGVLAYILVLLWRTTPIYRGETVVKQGCIRGETGEKQRSTPLLTALGSCSNFVLLYFGRIIILVLHVSI